MNIYCHNQLQHARNEMHAVHNDTTAPSFATPQFMASVYGTASLAHGIGKTWNGVYTQHSLPFKVWRFSGQPIAMAGIIFTVTTCLHPSTGTYVYYRYVYPYTR